MLLSALSRQFVIHGRSFAEKYPGDWLAWEGGTLQVSRGNNATEVTLSDGTDVQRPRVGDPLCFALPLPQEGVTVTIGRAEGNDLVLSDATVSRHHCTLMHRAGSWLVTAALEHHVVEVDGAKVEYGHWVPVSSGQRLKLGHLELGLVTSHGMMVRLARMATARK
jgi:hypothetical protein